MVCLKDRVHTAPGTGHPVNCSSMLESKLSYMFLRGLDMCVTESRTGDFFFKCSDFAAKMPYGVTQLLLRTYRHEALLYETENIDNGVK
jgi:hypothetical protein